MDVKITVQKSAVTVDEIGNHKAEWQNFYTCFATAGNESPSEDTAAGTVVDNSKINFTVRWCSVVSEIDSTKYRVKYNDEIYDILGIDHMNFKKKSVKLKCQKARR